GDRDRPGDLPGDAGRLGRQVRRLGHQVLRLARPGVDPADHLVAWREPGDTGAEPGDDAGEVAALPGRERGRPEVTQRPLADLRLARVNARRPDLDKHPAWAGLGHGS